MQSKNKVRLDEKKVVEETKAIQMRKKMQKERIGKAKVKRYPSQKSFKSRLDE